MQGNRKHVTMGGVVICWALVHGQGRKHMGCGYLGLQLPLGLFWSGSWNVPDIVNALRKCDKK